MTPLERLVMMDELTIAVRTMAREGLRRRHPELSEAELDDRFAELVLGKGGRRTRARPSALADTSALAMTRPTEYLAHVALIPAGLRNFSLTVRTTS